MTVQFSASYPVIGLYVTFGLVEVDVSEYIRSVSTNRPGSRETNRFQPGTMSVVLDNRDGRFSPANLTGPYVSGGASQVVSDIKVRLEATWGGTTYGLFAGYVEDWQDDFPGLGYDATTTLTAIDPLSLLSSWEGTPLDTPVGAGETSGARVTRILDAAGVIGPGNRSIMNGDEGMQATTLGGSAIALLNLTVDSEGGTYWYDPAVSGTGSFGAFVYESRSALASNTRSTVSQATFAAGSVPFRDPRTSSGRDQLLRVAALSRVGGVTQTVATFGLGGTTGLPRLARSDLVTETDVGVYSVAELLVRKGTAANAYRVTGLTIDPINSPAAMWPEALGLRIRDRATVSMTVPVSSLTINKNVFIDGVSHNITPMRWSTSFAFASATAWDGFTAAVWDTATWDGASSLWFF
jgi:hypothetical protein